MKNSLDKFDFMSRRLINSGAVDNIYFASILIDPVCAGRSAREKEALFHIIESLGAEIIEADWPTLQINVKAAADVLKIMASLSEVHSIIISAEAVPFLSLNKKLQP